MWFSTFYFVGMVESSWWARRNQSNFVRKSRKILPFAHCRNGWFNRQWFLWYGHDDWHRFCSSSNHWSDWWHRLHSLLSSAHLYYGSDGSPLRVLNIIIRNKISSSRFIFHSWQILSFGDSSIKRGRLCIRSRTATT